MIRLILAASAAICTGAAQAEVIWSYKSWAVEIDDSDDFGRTDPICVAFTSNRRDQFLAVFYGPGGPVAGAITDDRWDLQPRDVTAYLELDNSGWTLEAEADGDSIFWTIPGNAQGVQFLEDLSANLSAELFNDEDSKLAQFSLSGSRAALLKLLECARDIDAGTSNDPF